MKRQRAGYFFLAFAAIALMLATRALAGFTQQRDQIAVAIIVNVTPAPLGMQAPAPSVAAPLVARLRLREARGSAPDVDALRNTVAQSAAQHGVKVQAEVTPNPNATLLYTDQQSVILNGTAGTTITQPCAYHVNVHTTITSWTLDDGLSNDFTASFSGTKLANNTYSVAATPHPTATPFVVYADDGNHWALRVSAGSIQSYCVDLTLSIPAAVPGGTYSTNAVYTLYY